jgi:hypothetical protein
MAAAEAAGTPRGPHCSDDARDQELVVRLQLAGGDGTGEAADDFVQVHLAHAGIMQVRMCVVQVESVPHEVVEAQALLHGVAVA